MTAAWAEPIAGQLAKSRREMAEVVRKVPADAWAKPSDASGWSYHDHLSHLPASHAGVQSVMRSVIEGRAPDLSRFAVIDEANEENRQQNIDRGVDQLLGEFTAANEETERLVRQLTEDHEQYDLGPMKLGQALNGFAMHDFGHMDEIRKTLG
ncbi:MAG: maleylpyruvate isomerase N-terminal domain-containing protein [Chloroflexota bacterium]